MKVTIDKNELYLDPEIIVKCKEIDEVLQDIISYIGIADKNVIGKKLNSVKSAKNAKLEGTLINKEKILISRQYVAEIKKRLGV